MLHGLLWQRGRLIRAGWVVGTIAAVLLCVLATAAVLRHHSAQLPAGGGAPGDVRDIGSDGAAGRDQLERRVAKNGWRDLFILPSDSGPIQKELKAGVWLVYICAEWSLDDAVGVKTAAEVGSSLRGTAKVAIREYLDYDDIRKNYPRFGPHWIGPTPPSWTILSDGKVLGDLRGPHSSDEVVAFVRQRLRDGKGGLSRKNRPPVDQNAERIRP